MYLHTFITLAFVAANLAAVAASPFRVRRDAVGSYCLRHASHYRRYCTTGDLSDFDFETRYKLAKFCPAYEDNCGVVKANLIYAGPDVGLVVPPALPKSSDFKFDLPIGHQTKFRPIEEEKHVKPSELTPEMVATCTPDCTAPHCTTTCKCANTHPKVHSMCNPPATAELDVTCKKWYEKCPMFQPISYY